MFLLTFVTSQLMSEACFWWGRPVLLKVLPEEDKGEARVHVHVYEWDINAD